MAWVLLIPAALCVRRPPRNLAPAQAPAQSPARTVSAADPGQPRRDEVVRALTSPQFLVLGFTFMFCCMAHSGPIFHVVSYAMYCGLGAAAAVSVYSVEGLAGLGGRVLIGMLADRFGARRLLVCTLALQSLCIAAYLKVNELPEFYALAAIFGVAYGGGMPLYASIAREYFGQHIMGTVFGAATMLSSLGMAVGPVAGGWVFDHFDGYAWLYIASAAVALGAVMLALMFPKPGLVREPAAA
jgi:MFS family permease